jgi:ribose transport system permease protein
VTLAVGIMARSLVMYFMRGATVMGNNIPQFTSIGNGSVFSIPIPFILVVAVAIIFHIFLTRTKFGTYVFAVGGNENAARYSGIKVDRIRIATYMIVGLCTGMAATIEMSRMAAVAAATSGSQYEFEAITAVIVGGTSLNGGKGRLIGSIVGFIILGIVNNMMIMLNISPYLSGAVKGAVILFAVLMQRRER